MFSRGFQRRSSGVLGGFAIVLTGLLASPSLAGFIGAGGSETDDAYYLYYSFLSSGTLDVTSNGVVDVLVVGGGGGGGARGDKGGGGGGAGGLIYDLGYSVSPGTINVLVGAGGSGGTGSGSYALPGSNGQDSAFGSLVAIGGGGGGAGRPGAGTNAHYGRNGGSGGGGSESASGGAGTSGQGYAGGRTVSLGARAGGGGGAGGAGQDSASSGGGIGRQINITGTPVWYAGGGAGGDNWNGGGVAPGGGGLGGGGGSGVDGLANTGGGGGGGWAGHYSGGAGGSGVVIVRVAKDGVTVPLAGANSVTPTFVSDSQLLPSSSTDVLSLEVRSGGALFVGNGQLLTSTNGVVVASGGAMTGCGAVHATCFNSGTIAPASSASSRSTVGTFVIQGGLTQTTAGQTLFDLAGYTQGSGYDFLHVTGQATLEGSIVASKLSSFTPTNNSTFDLLTADGGIQFGATTPEFQLPVGFWWSLVNNNKTLELLYNLGNERHYAGFFQGDWQSSSVWTDRFGSVSTGAPAPTANDSVFINKNSVLISRSGAQAKSVLVNGGKLVVDGSLGGALTVAQGVELGNSTHQQSGVANGQGWVQQTNGGQVVINGDLVIGGQDSVYEMVDNNSRLNVKGNVNLLAGTNAFFHQRGGTVIIGSSFDSLGHSDNGLLDLGSATSYQMDGGVLDVATIRQTGQFIFNGGSLYVKHFLINTTPADPTPTYVPSPSPPATAAPTPSAAASQGGGGGYVTASGGFTLEQGIVVLDQYSDWRLQGQNANLTIGHNRTGASNGSFVQNGGNVQVDGELVIGDEAGGKGNYSMTDGSLHVVGQMVLGRAGGVGQFYQTGGAVSVDGALIITESTSGSSRFDILGGSMTTLSLSIGENGGPGSLNIGKNATVHVKQNLVVGLNGKVTGSGIFDIQGAQVLNNGLISPGNSPGELTFDANYVQGSTGTLRMEFASATEAGVGYDHMTINGDLSLNGTLDLAFLDGFAPSAGQVYDLIQVQSQHTMLTDASDLRVEVEGLKPGWQYSVTFDPVANQLQLTSLNDGMSTVPEPVAAGIALLGCMGLMGRRPARRWRCKRAA